MARLYLVRRLCSVARNHLQISFSELLDRFRHILLAVAQFSLFLDVGCGNGCGDGYGFVGFLGEYEIGESGMISISLVSVWSDESIRRAVSLALSGLDREKRNEEDVAHDIASEQLLNFDFLFSAILLWM